MGNRYFILEENKATKVSNNIFEPFRRGEGCIEGYKNKTIHVASVSIETKDRKPIRITYIECCKLLIDDKGAIEKEWSEGMGSLESISFHEESRSNGGPVVDARKTFKQRQYLNKYIWKINKIQVDAICELLGINTES